MKKRYFHGILTLLLVVFIGVSAVIIVRSRSKNDIVTNLSERLIALGVPLDSVIVRSEDPFKIEIRLNMINEAGNQLTKDTWYLDLAKHEASISHKYGFDLDGFYISYVSESGKEFRSTYFGIPSGSPARQPFIPDPTKLDNAATKALLLETLNFGGMTVEELEVSTGAGSRDDVQTLIIRLSVPDVQSAAEGIPKLLGSIRSQLWKINEDHETTQISICRVWVVDATGKELLKYTNDLEAGHIRWITGDPIIEDTFGGPLPEEVPSPSQEPEEYPTPTPT